MKSTSSAIREHLDSDVTALCTCWKIVRQDGKVLCFTDADIDLTVEGLQYQSIGAYSRTAIESTASLSVDNLDVSGMATDLVLPLNELRAGAFDNAKVFIFMTPWINPSYGYLKLRQGFFGEVRVLPNGTFDVELRGLLQKLAHNYTEVFSATCRNDLGDRRCLVDLSHPFNTQGAHVPLPLQDSTFEELGSYGALATRAWYDPTASTDVLVTAAPTHSGTYAARGGATGFLQQDIPLTPVGTSFMEHVSDDKVEFNLRGWRRDNGASGRLSVRFLDDQSREVRTAAYYSLPNTYLSMPAVEVLSGDFTTEFWIRATETAQDETPILSGTYTQNELGVPHTYRFSIIHETGNGGQSLYLYESVTSVPTNVSEYREIAANVSYADGEWHHVAVVRSGSNVLLYIDAKLVGTLPHTTSFVGKPWGIQHFGGRSGDSSLQADWDEIRVWNVARPQWLIASERFRDQPSGTGNLLHYFPFENGLADEGSSDLGDATLGTGVATQVTTRAPVRASYRGTVTSVTTGFVNVGDAWTLTELTGSVPATAAYMRVVFEGQAGSGPASGALLDSLFGYFTDADSLEQFPNLAESGTHWKRAGMAISSSGARIFRASITEPRAVNGWFNGGLVTFYSGKNAGGSMEVKRWTQATGEIELFLSLPYPVEAGDVFTVYPGCDKSRICCTALFNNIVNMFATPDVPGEDELFRYPDAK